MRRVAPLFCALAIACLAMVSVLYLAPRAIASDHQDSPLTVARPGADITDIYVFPANDPAKVVFVMDVFPLIPPGLGTQTFFDPGVLYQFKIGLQSDATEDLVIQFKPDVVGANQKIAMYGPGRPGIVGTRNAIVTGSRTGAIPYNQVTDLGQGIMAFAGPREDPFYFDLARFSKIEPDRDFSKQPNPPPNSERCFRKNGVDFLAGYNVLSIVVEVPRTLLADGGQLGRINVWGTTSLKDSDPDASPQSPLASLANVVRNHNTRTGGPTDESGTWTQVERLARPAVKEATEAFRNHDATNRAALTDDGVLAKSIREYMIHTAGRSTAVADAAVKALMPDHIEADLSQSGPARYLAVETNGKSGLPVQIIRTVPPDGIEGIKKALGDPYRQFGGRDPKSPVIDLSLGAIYGSLIPKLGLAPDDNRETDCLTSDHTTPAAKHPLRGFPYLGDPR
ncbi:MAG: hypothetical protein JWM87_2399 [Candidatus Eremiobacteraeota bacterium]|nr:hypothetical protein [Candidatus Eremiobacteraeota bacterium]